MESNKLLIPYSTYHREKGTPVTITVIREKNKTPLIEATSAIFVYIKPQFVEKYGMPDPGTNITLWFSESTLPPLTNFTIKEQDYRAVRPFNVYQL